MLLPDRVGLLHPRAELVVHIRERVQPEQVRDFATIGELALDGSVRPVKERSLSAMAPTRYSRNANSLLLSSARQTTTSPSSAIAATQADRSSSVGGR